MISAAYVRAFTRYNASQNRSLYREAGRLGDAGRRADRGAYFGSIHRTLCHILTADHIWMSRFDGWDMPPARGDSTPDWITGWETLAAARLATDVRLIDWSARLDDARLAGNLGRAAGHAGEDRHKGPLWPLVVHMFNHQTHHRGQVHAMLTAAGRHPDPTDFEFVPDRGTEEPAE